MKFLNSLLDVESKDRTMFQIILWWEFRRILYNVIVLVSGILSMSIMLIIVDVKPGEDLQEPLAIIGFGILCNLGYTFGWLTEIARKKTKTYGPLMFKIGLCFTLFFVFAPAILLLIMWLRNMMI